MNICLLKTPVVGTVEGNSFRFDVITSWTIREVFGIVEDGRFCWDMTGPITKVIDFVHVQPEPIKGYLLIEGIKHIHPVLSSIRMKEIDKGRVPRPYFSNIRFAIRLLCKNIPF